MDKKRRIITVGAVVVAALVLSACGVAQPPLTNPPSDAPGYRYGPGGMGGGMGGGMMGGGMGGGMMGGGMGGGMMGGGMGGMMGGYGQGGYDQSPATGTATVPVDGELQITTVNNRFTPAQIAVKPGESVRLVVTNAENVPHNLISEAAGLPYLALPGGETQTLTWTAPTQAGEYIAVCTFHPGMSLQITVAE